MSRGIVDSLRTQEQMFRQMGNTAQANYHARAIKEIEAGVALREAVETLLNAIDSVEFCGVKPALEVFSAAKNLVIDAASKME